jgi:sialic acid synthase SpsE
LGAKIIEKHITLDNNLDGPDHSSSLAVNELSEFIKILTDLSLSINNKNRELTNAEKKNKKLVTRSLYFINNFKKSHKISEDDIVPLRPFGNGYPIEKFKNLIGKKIRYTVKKGSLIKKNII